MKEQPEALRLADELEDEHYPWPRFPAAAELRRLHAENEAIHQAITDPENQPSQFGTVTFAMYEALKAQRDALLEACKAYDQWADKTLCYDRVLRPIRAQIRAAIKAVEEGK